MVFLTVFDRHCPKFLLLLGHHFLDHLTKGNGIFLSLFFWSLPVGGPGLQTSAAPCPGYMRSSKEIEGTPCCLVGQVSQVPHVPRQPTFLFWSFRVFLRLLVVWYLGIFTYKGEELGGMRLIHLGETESNIHFSMKNAHLCHLNSTGTLWYFLPQYLRRVRLFGKRDQIISFVFHTRANSHLYLSKSNCKHLKIIIWLSHFN